MTDSQSSAKRKGRFPPWLRKRLTLNSDVDQVRRMIADLGLATVCSSAHCPNIGECFARHSATFLIMGNTCTRNCRFCAIQSADPGPLRDDEPDAVAEACHRLALRHVVITSVTRDDLPDGGASHVARTIQAIRHRLPNAVIEVLTPDFQGSTDAIDTVLAAQPAIFNHNVETVPRLYAHVRPQARYTQSLAMLAYVKRKATRDQLPLHTKSGIMVGLGETNDEVENVMRDLRNAQCDMLTIGQYLAPSPDHAPVVRYVEPAQFDAWKATARRMGFAAVATGPFVRSSYHADDMFESRTQED